MKAIKVAGSLTHISVVSNWLPTSESLDHWISEWIKPAFMGIPFGSVAFDRKVTFAAGVFIVMKVSKSAEE